jgi:organic hydroperoxide reductase OsmC/OhrA
MTAPFPHRYEVSFEARGRDGWLTSANRARIEGGAPPEFDGSPHVWSPEHLLLSSIALCYFTTFRTLAGKARLDVLDFRAKAEGVLSKTPEGLGFTEFRLVVDVAVGAEGRAEAERLAEAAKRHCLVANALRTPVRLEVRVLSVSAELSEVR